MTSEAIKLSVVVPAYNEEARIARCLEEVGNWLVEFGSKAEVVVVDDGSGPQGRQAVESRLAALPAGIERQLLTHQNNLGKGAAVRTGCLAARGEYVAFLDADLASPPRDLSVLLAALDAGADVSIGVRNHGGGQDMRASRGWTRRVLGKLFSSLTQVLLSLKVSDTQCPLKAFRRSAAQRLFRLQTIKTWSFDAELLFLAERLKLRVAKAPVGWRPVPGSHLRLNLRTASEVLNLTRLRWSHRQVRETTLAEEAANS